LNVGCAFIDAQRPDFPIQALDDMAAAHAVAAMNLHRLVDHVLGTIGRVELGHRGFAADPSRAHVLEPGCPIGQERGGIDIQRHVRQMALHHLQLRHRGPEQLSRPHPLDGLIERAARKAERGRRDR